MTARRILLADADAFFVAVARMIDPDGAGKEPLLIVGGTRESRGVVCSASYEARKFGVRSAMPIARALRLCPAAMCVPVPRRACGEKSREIRAVLERFAPIVDGASIDEWYMDLGGTEAPLRRRVARRHRASDARRRRRGDRAVGVDRRRNDEARRQARRRAREAQARHRRDRCARRSAGDEEAFLATFELADIPMIGPRFQERLARLGMQRVPDVLQYDVATLTQLARRRAKRAGSTIACAASTAASSKAHGEAKSISRDDTFPRDINDDDELAKELLALVTRAARDLRGDGLVARTITVRIRDHDFKTRQANRTLDRAGDVGPRHPGSRARAARQAARRAPGSGAPARRKALLARRGFDCRPTRASSSSATERRTKPNATGSWLEPSIGSAKNLATRGFCRPDSSTEAAGAGYKTFMPARLRPTPGDNSRGEL